MLLDTKLYCFVTDACVCVNNWYVMKNVNI